MAHKQQNNKKKNTTATASDGAARGAARGGISKQQKSKQQQQQKNKKKNSKPQKQSQKQQSQKQRTSSGKKGSNNNSSNTSSAPSPATPFFDVKKYERKVRLVQQSENAASPSSASSSRTNHAGLTPLQSLLELKLQESKFRLLNEKMYSMSGEGAQQMFDHDPKLFEEYHRGYRFAIQDWSSDPVDSIASFLKQKRNRGKVVADMGCGEAKIARQMPAGHLGGLHSFDLVALNEHVTACDIAHTPLEDGSVDIVVFCLSLMGTNFLDYLVEGQRILKLGGNVVIAEPDSRIVSKLKLFDIMRKLGLELEKEERPNNFFRIFYFNKTSAESRRPNVDPKKIFGDWKYKKRSGT